MTMATITVLGRLGRDPELKNHNGQSIADMSLAVSTKRGGEETTTWYRAAAWGKPGEIIAQYAKKGDLLSVSGAFLPREYTTKDGVQKTSYEIDVKQFAFAGKPNASAEPARASGSYGQASSEDVAF